MALTDVYKDVIGIVNEVERKLGVNESSRTDQTKTTKLLVDLLNDTIDECNDFGDWPQMFREATVTVSSSSETIEIVVSAQLKNILEIYFDTQKSPMQPVDVPRIRQRQKSRSFGPPREFAVVEVSGVNAKIRTAPIPGANENNKTLDIAYYKKNRMYQAVTADSTAVPMFPAKVLVHGTYAKALLEESGQQKTAEVEVAEAKYMKMRQEALNRLQADSVKDVTFYVGRR